ncbi:MAG: S-layer homology domain-containing protein [Chloroflexota bacterium]
MHSGSHGSARTLRLALTLALAVVLLLGQTVTAQAALVGDIAGSVYEPAISALRQVGIVGPEWWVSLRPQELLTRAEEARLLARALTGESNARGFLPLRYPDVAADHWAKPYIDTAVHLKLMPGQADAAFNPNGKIARGQFALDILKLCGYHPSSTAAAMELALELGLLDGSSTSTYAYITRGDAVTMAYRAFFGVYNPELGSTLARRIHGSRLRPVPVGETTPTLEFRFLPAAGATLVRLPSGADWLIDTGSPATLPSLFAYLAHLGVERLDAMVITNSRLSPAGAVAAVSDRLAPAATVRLESLAADAQGFPTSLLAGDKDVKVDVIARPLSTGTYSTALRISRGSLRVLLSRSVDAAGERLLAAQDKAKLAADVWLPGSFGYYEQHDYSFLMAVGPGSVVATGDGDPIAADLYAGLLAVGSQVLMPDADGAVSLAVTSRGISTIAPQPSE